MRTMVANGVATAAPRFDATPQGLQEGPDVPHFRARDVQRPRCIGAAGVAAFALMVGVATAEVANVPTWGSAQAPRLVVQSGPRNPVGLNITLSLNKQLMATAGGEVGAAYVWQVETGRLLCTLKADMDRDMAFLTLGLPPMTFSTDGNLLATANERGISVWDVRLCRLRATLSRFGDGSEAVTGLLTLANGRVLASSDEGRLYKGDLFAGAGALQALPKAPHGSDLLYGRTRDGRLVLASGREGEEGISPLIPSALRVVDVETGDIDKLASYRGVQAAAGGFMAQMMPRAATISRSGRWVIELHQGVATLYDRQSRSVAGRASLFSADAGAGAGAPAGKAAARAPGADPLAKMNAQMADMFKALPPSMRGELEQELKKLGESVPKVVGVGAMPSRSPEAVPSGMAGWVGFSENEDLVYVWKNPGPRGATGEPPQREPAPVIEVRRVPTLELVNAVPISDPSAVNRQAAGVATGFAVSPDGLALGVSLITGDLAGGRVGSVDLRQLPQSAAVRAWKPTGNGPGLIEWTADGHLVAVHAGALGGGNMASLAGRGAPGGALVPGARAPPAQPRQHALLVRWALGGGEITTRDVDTADLLPLAMARGGRFVALLKGEGVGDSKAKSSGGYRLEVVDSQTQRPVHEAALENVEVAVPTGLEGIALSPDGQRVAVLVRAQPSRARSRSSEPVDSRQRLSIHEASTGRMLSEQALPIRVGNQGFMQPKLRFTADGKTLFAVSEKPAGELLRIDLQESGAISHSTLKVGGGFVDVLGEGPLRLLVSAGRPPGPSQFGGMAVIRLPIGGQGMVKADASGAHLAAAEENGQVRLLDISPAGTASDVATLQGHVSKVVSLAFSPDGRRLASSDEQGSTFIWDLASRTVLARLFSFTDGSWAVVDAQGRFDTNNLEDLEYLHWVMPDDPLRALPLDLFMREYFSPGLLARLLRGEALPAVRPVNALNRAQPLVRIVAIAPTRADSRRVDVTVEAEGRSDDAGRPGGVTDLRLFRDGKLVGYPERPGEPLSLDPRTRRTSITFRNVRLPQGTTSVSFSAYAFNSDLVKSATARSEYPVPTATTAASKAKGKAYVIAIGVNGYDNPAFNLRFAVNDARLASAVLSSRLIAGRLYREVVTVPLVSEVGGSRDATKARIRAVLAVLAGKPADRFELAAISNAAQLEAATPDDLVIITFAGHGHAGDAGVFYLLPQDIGGGNAMRVTPQLLGQSISSDELEHWLRDVDAGEMAMVIDACHSAASVEGDGFKPGPMGSRGLGQLAYDKGMRILAASQANDVALEADKLLHGLLTFVLMRDGIESQRADFKPADKRIELAEWLAFAVEGVPQLQRELASGKRESQGNVRAATRPGAPTARVQQPRLFDFSRRADGPTIEVLP
jgi:Caspase domain/WD domain, G-beta repeat